MICQATDCLLYAVHTLKERFEEAEDIIATDSGASYNYAKDVIKGRWEMGEEAIADSETWIKDYLNFANLSSKDIALSPFWLYNMTGKKNVETR